MAWITPDSVPYLLVGGASVLLAIWLLALDATSRVNRVFAALLMLRGAALFVGPIYTGMAISKAKFALFYFIPYITIPVVPIVIAFLSVYPRRRGIIGTTRWGPWLLIVPTLTFMGLYAWDHSLYWTPFVLGERLLYDYAWMGVLGTLRLPVLAVAAYVLSRDYRRAPGGSAGFSTFLVAAGFTMNALFDGVLFTTTLWIEAGYEGWVPLLTEFWITFAVPTLCLPFALLALVEMGRAMAHEKGDSTLQEARRFLLVAVPLVIGTGVLAGYNELNGTGQATEFLRGFWNLLGPATIAYALLRFNLFDADVRLKAGVRRGIMLAAFTTAFFVVVEAAEALLTDGRGPAAGIAIAALLAVTARPMQQVARVAADRLMPDTPEWHTLGTAGRERLYHDQFKLVGSDGVITAKEQRMLGQLAEALRLDPGQVARLESDGPIEEDTPSSPARRHHGSWRRSLIVGLATAMVFGAVSQLGESLFEASNFAMSLLTAAAVTLMLGPIERLALRFESEPAVYDAATLDLYQQELDASLSDGDWSRRDRRYMNGLAEHLGIDARTRTRLDRMALRSKGLGPVGLRRFLA